MHMRNEAAHGPAEMARKAPAAKHAREEDDNEAGPAKVPATTTRRKLNSVPQGEIATAEQFVNAHPALQPMPAACCSLLASTALASWAFVGVMRWALQSMIYFFLENEMMTRKCISQPSIITRMLMLIIFIALEHARKTLHLSVASSGG